MWNPIFIIKIQLKFYNNVGILTELNRTDQTKLKPTQTKPKLRFKPFGYVSFQPKWFGSVRF